MYSSSDVEHDIVVMSFMNMSSDVAHVNIVTSYMDISSHVAHVIEMKYPYMTSPQ
jgi:hypothetical protein